MVQLTCASGTGFDLHPELAAAHDLVILDIDGMENVAAHLHALACMYPALIYVCGENKLAFLVQSLCGTACDILLKPLSSEELVAATQKTLRTQDQSRCQALKYRKMRELVRRVVRERRDLSRRMELVCRDLVEAHRRLTYRFVELQKTQSGQA